MHVVALKYRRVIAIARATNGMHWAFAAGTVCKTPMAMGNAIGLQGAQILRPVIMNPKQIIMMALVSGVHVIRL
jgi:hypothetical protein